MHPSQGCTRMGRADVQPLVEDVHTGLFSEEPDKERLSVLHVPLSEDPMPVDAARGGVEKPVLFEPGKDVEGVHLCPEVTVIPGIVPAHEMADSRRLMAPGKRRDAHELMVDPVGCRGYINRPASGME